MTYTTSGAQTLSDDTYYLNNMETGKYLRYASSTATAASGMLSSLGNSIRWEVRQVDGGYAIRSASDPTKYLSVSSNPSITTVGVTTVQNAMVPNTCKWKITPVGGLLLKSAYNNAYLYLDGPTLKTSTTLGTTGSSTYNSRVWRCASISYYGNTASHDVKELNSFTVANSTICVGEPFNPNITSNTSNLAWTKAYDFVYSESDICVQDVSTGTIIGAYGGTATITATHKVTGISVKFTLTVKEHLLNASCYEGQKYDTRTGIGKNCSALYSADITWESSSPYIATVSSSGLITGMNSGYTFISATNSDGITLLQCEFQVNNELSDKLKNFNRNEIEYLYCPSTYLNKWSRNLTDPFAFKVELLLCLQPYYLLSEDEQPNGEELKNILKTKLNFTIDADSALWLFNECYLGYRGKYNPEYLEYLRQQYFASLKQFVSFCAFSMAGKLDPVNTGSNCKGYDDLVYDLSRQWGNNENSQNVMLGSNGYQGKYYFKEAQKYGYRYFYSTNYNDCLNTYGSDFVRSVNIRYLQRCIDSGCNFYFCSNPQTAPLSSSLHMEFSYLQNYYASLWGAAYLRYDPNLGLWYFFNLP